MLKNLLKKWVFLSTIINTYLKQFIRNKKVYFTITSNMSPELENLLGKVEFDI